MRNYECSVCNGICDPGELIGNTCIECLEKERIRMQKRERVRRMQASPFEQMKFDFGVKKDAI